VSLNKVIESIQRELVGDDAFEAASKSLRQHLRVGEEHRVQDADLVIGEQNVARTRRFRQVVEIIFERLAILFACVIAPLAQNLQEPLAADTGCL
jgi:hypothetical protein